MKIPQSLEELFKKMCVVLEKTESLGLHEGFVLRSYYGKLSNLSHEIEGFAERYREAQIKLLERVPKEQVPHYQASFAAYANCGPKAEQFTDEEDVSSKALHF